jgi:hypothetical protein
MDNKASIKLYSDGRKILLLLVVVYLIWLGVAISNAYPYFSLKRDLLPHIPVIPSLILFVVAIFWGKEHPKAIGASLMVLGVISGVLLFRFRVFDDFMMTSDYIGDYVCCLPTYVILFILGYRFLLRGYSDGSRQKSDVMHKI